MAQQISDDYILKLFKDPKSKEKAFEMLLEKYKSDIYYSIRRLVFLHDDANDVTQNVWIKVWRYLSNFRGDSSLKTWITKICVNESLTFIEKKKKLLNLNDDGYTEWMLQTIPEDRYFSADKIQQLIQTAIQMLPPKQRAVFNLRYYDEMPYEEMAKVLNTSVGSLKASYHFAAQKIEDFLKKN